MTHDEMDDANANRVLDDDTPYQVLPEGEEDALVELLKSFHSKQSDSDRQQDAAR
ncbi:MAG TPA: hypothetical protein VE869_03085 [Gemmatimonas sp.]|nr:hypothetical protein [Gemmatimonas sp.]